MRKDGLRNNGLRKIAAIAMMALLMPGQALLAQADTTGAVVTSGAAEIARSGNVTNINQSTEMASINWHAFNISFRTAKNKVFGGCLN